MKAFRNSSLRSRRLPAVDLLSIVPAALVSFAVVAIALPPRSGPLALVLVLEPQIFIAVLLMLTPFALLARSRLLGAALAVTLIAGGGFFGSEWVSLPGSGAGRHDLAAMTWNLEYGTRTPAETVSALKAVNVDLIALQEIEPEVSEAVAADAAMASRYPYRAMAPRPGALGLAILSRYPVEKVDSDDNPARLELVVATPRGPIRVINGHPMLATIGTSWLLPLLPDFDPSDRDAAIAKIREWIDPALSGGERLLVLGDFNTTPSESEYKVLTAGLRDTHVEVGEGPGWTWRPGRLAFLNVAFLRIDLQLSAGPIRPASTSLDCSLPGDHCRLFGDYQIDA